MSIFRYIAAGSLGFAFGGVIGSVLAITATHFMSKTNTCLLYTSPSPRD